MKNICKLLSSLVIVMCAGIVLLTCSSTKTTENSTAQVSAPAWVDELPPSDVYWGIGFAKLQNEGLARDTATARARSDVAAQLGVLVQGMLTDYARESGTLNNSASIQSIERIGRDIIDMNLAGATPNARTRMNDGTWWVRVSISKANLQRHVNDIFQTEASRYADFKSQEAQKMLDTQLKQSHSRPTPRAE